MFFYIFFSFLYYGLIKERNNNEREREKKKINIYFKRETKTSVPYIIIISIPSESTRRAFDFDSKVGGVYLQIEKSKAENIIFCFGIYRI